MKATKIYGTSLNNTSIDEPRMVSIIHISFTSRTVTRIRTRKHRHILNRLSGTIDSKRERRIHTYNTNIWVFNPVYEYLFIDFQNY